MFGSRRLYAAVAPVVGLSLGVDLGDGIRIRAAAAGELTAQRADAASLAPGGSDASPTACTSWSEHESSWRAQATPGELGDAVTALGLATSGPIAAGPVLFERLDWRPYGIRPVLPVANRSRG